MKEYYQIDCPKFCGGIEVENGLIVNGMPVIQKFKGQPVSNLTGWVKKVFGWVTLKKIKDKL